MNLFLIWTCGPGGDVDYNISYLELWQPSCSVERNHICNFCRGHYGEHSCEAILNYRRLPDDAQRTTDEDRSQ